MKTNLMAGLLTGLLSLWLVGCQDHRSTTTPTFPDRINFVAQRLYPEGIAYSAQLDKFVITSLTQGTIGTVDAKGQYEELLADPALITGLGVRVANGKVLVCNGDQGISVKSTPASILQTAELLVFDLSARRLEKRINLGALLPASQPKLANDLALSPDGTVYVTDSFAPVIYQVTPDGQARILVRDTTRFSSRAFGLNGIVYHPDGYLLVANTGQGKLFKVELQNGNVVSEVGGVTHLPGDGLSLDRANNLYVVTGNQVSQLRSTDRFATASVVKVDDVGYSEATTSVYVNPYIYTLNARIGEVGTAAGAGNPALLQASDYSIQRFR